MHDITVLLHLALIGIGATAIMDGWALLLWWMFKIGSLDFALVGRWVGHMRAGTLRHTSIVMAPRVRHERAVGWSVHYATGVLFALIFGGLVGLCWLGDPTVIEALAFGALTLVFPFFIMQPAFGLGVAASKTPNPTASRFKSMSAHLSFGFGLYLTALVLKVFT